MAVAKFIRLVRRAVQRLARPRVAASARNVIAFHAGARVRTSRPYLGQPRAKRIAALSLVATIGFVGGVLLVEAAVTHHVPPTGPRPGAIDLPARPPLRVSLLGHRSVAIDLVLDRAPVTARIVDGDTLAVERRRLRLEAIDAPELGQLCTHEGRDYDCGRRAAAALAALIADRRLWCNVVGVDRYRRELVACRRDDHADPAAALVEAGWALAYRRYTMRYVAQEDAARYRRVGIWAGSFEAPESWRTRAP